MLIHCSLLLWAVIQVLIPGSETNSDPILCNYMSNGQCNYVDVKKMCIDLCADMDVCKSLSRDKCKDATVRKLCPELCIGHALCKNINKKACKDDAVRQDCPYTCNVECNEADGFFGVPESGIQCFKFFPDSRQSWDASKKLCNEYGLKLAHPDDPATAVAVRKVIVEKYGFTTDKQWTWLGARGTSSSDGTGHVKWISDKTILSGSSSAWWPGSPGTSTSTSWCVVLLTAEVNINLHPTQPYYIQPCSKALFTLCEVDQ